MSAFIITFDFTDKPSEERDDRIIQGATDPRRFIWQDSNRVPVDLAGYDAVFQIRSSITGPVLAELSKANGGIVLNEVLGAIDLKFTPLTAAWRFRRGVCGLELTSADGTVTRFLQGAFELNREIVRA